MLKLQVNCMSLIVHVLKTKTLKYHKIQQANTLLKLLLNYNRCIICTDRVGVGCTYRHLYLVVWPLNVKATTHTINPLKAELIPMWHLLILLGDLTFMGTCIVSISNATHSTLKPVPTLPRQRQIAVTMLWQIPDAVVTVVCAPDDGWKYHPKHVEQFPDINKLCNFASCWMYKYIGILLGAHPILHISRIKVQQRTDNIPHQHSCLQLSLWHWIPFLYV
jgi:hypothetical protein